MKLFGCISLLCSEILKTDIDGYIRVYVYIYIHGTCQKKVPTYRGREDVSGLDLADKEV